jgi:hypothetical protein
MAAGKWNPRIEAGTTYLRRITITNDDEVVADPDAVPPVIGVPATPVDLTGYTTRWRFWNSDTDEVVYTATTENGAADITDPSNGLIVLNIPHATTSTFPDRAKLRHQLDIILADVVTRVLEGRVFVDPEYV